MGLRSFLKKKYPKSVEVTKWISYLAPVGTVFDKDGDLYIIRGMERKKYDVTIPQQQEDKSTKMMTYSVPAYYAKDIIYNDIKDNKGYFKKTK